MEYPPHRRPDPVDRRSRSWLAIVLAGLFGMAVIVTLSFLTLGSFGPVLLMGVILLAITGLHYFVWGWWLQKVLRREQEQEADQ